MKEKIPESVRYKVWDMYIGLDKAIDKCFCCNAILIQLGSFQCGHIVSEYHGGRVRIDNLRPICTKCNCSMGKRNMIEFMDYHGYDFREDFNGKDKKLDLNELIKTNVQINKPPKIEQPIKYKIPKYNINNHPDISHQKQMDDDFIIETYTPIKKVDPSTLWEWAMYKK
jgi:hypothetical protein